MTCPLTVYLYSHLLLQTFENTSFVLTKTCMQGGSVKVEKNWHELMFSSSSPISTLTTLAVISISLDLSVWLSLWHLVYVIFAHTLLKLFTQINVELGENWKKSERDSLSADLVHFLAAANVASQMLMQKWKGKKVFALEYTLGTLIQSITLFLLFTIKEIKIYLC